MTTLALTRPAPLPMVLPKRLPWELLNYLTPWGNMVRREALKLDGIRHDWADRVNPDRLSMVSVTGCVLGQAFEDKARGYGSGYGFAIRAYPQLEVDAFYCFSKAWKREIRARQMA